MQREIQLTTGKIAYTLKISSRAHRVRLSVYCDGRFVVTAPRYVSSFAVENFIIEKSRWIVDKINYFKTCNKTFFIKNTKDSFLENKDKARDLVEHRIGYYNRIYGLRFNRVSIKDQRTRWGSCSRSGNLNFNYKIALLPPELADYIIVHELCHLAEFNHRSSFWDLVGKTIPDHQKRRQELQRYALGLG